MASIPPNYNVPKGHSPLYNSCAQASGVVWGPAVMACGLIQLPCVILAGCCPKNSLVTAEQCDRISVAILTESGAKPNATLYGYQKDTPQLRYESWELTPPIDKIFISRLWLLDPWARDKQARCDLSYAECAYTAMRVGLMGLMCGLCAAPAAYQGTSAQEIYYPFINETPSKEWQLEYLRLTIGKEALKSLFSDLEDPLLAATRLKGILTYWLSNPEKSILPSSPIPQEEFHALLRESLEYLESNFELPEHVYISTERETPFGESMAAYEASITEQPRLPDSHFIHIGRPKKRTPPEGSVSGLKSLNQGSYLGFLPGAKGLHEALQGFFCRG